MRTFSTTFKLERLALAIGFGLTALACWLGATGASPWLAGLPLWIGWFSMIYLLDSTSAERRKNLTPGVLLVAAVAMAILLVLVLGAVNFVVFVAVQASPWTAQVFDFILRVLMVCSASATLMLLGYLVYLEIHERVGKARKPVP